MLSQDDEPEIVYPLLAPEHYREFASDEHRKLLGAIEAGFTADNVEAQTKELEDIFFALPWDGQHAMVVEDAQFGPALENWVKLKPDSVLARLCLGMALVDRAWELRGDETIDKVTQEGYAGFEDHLLEGVRALMPITELRPDNAMVYFELLQAFVGLGDKEEQVWAYENAIRIEPENLLVHTRYMWSCSPRWNCTFDPDTGKVIDDTDIVLENMRNFAEDWMGKLSSPAKSLLWYFYLEECSVEMHGNAWETYAYSDAVRDKSFALIDSFTMDDKLSMANINHANRLLYTAYDIDLCERDLRAIADVVLPGNIDMSVWDSYCDTPYEVAEAIKNLIESC